MGLELQQISSEELGLNIEQLAQFAHAQVLAKVVQKVANPEQMYLLTPQTDTGPLHKNLRSGFELLALTSGIDALVRLIFRQSNCFNGMLLVYPPGRFNRVEQGSTNYVYNNQALRIESIDVTKEEITPETLLMGNFSLNYNPAFDFGTMKHTHLDESDMPKMDFSEWVNKKFLDEFFFLRAQLMYRRARILQTNTQSPPLS